MNICIATLNRELYSETFIHAHIERLPGRVAYLYGAPFPVYAFPDRLLLPIVHPAVNRYLARRMQVNQLAFDRAVMRRMPRALRHCVVRRFLRREEIDAVLTEYALSGVELMDVCSELAIPLIVHFHGHDAYDRDILRQFGGRYPALFEKCARIVVVSRDMERRVIERGAPREKVVYNPCGVDTAFFQGADPRSGPPVFIGVGRFTAIKGPHLTILAFRTVFEACPDARLVLIGDGELMDVCRQLVKALDLESAVDLVGVRTHEGVRDAMRSATVFVQHSMPTTVVESEGTPVAVLEAGASGLPAVTTRNGGLKDVVVHGETGFLVEEGDVEGMAAYMLTLAKDRDLAGRMGAAARERICAEFSMDKSLARLQRTIESAVEENHASPRGRQASRGEMRTGG